CLGILPFLVLRTSNGEWLRAAIDLGLVATIVASTCWSWRRGRHRLVTSALVVSVSAGLVAVAATGGREGVFWTYPTIAAIFMLAPRWVAVGCAGAMLGAIALLPA